MLLRGRRKRYVPQVKLFLIFFLINRVCILRCLEFNCTKIMYERYFHIYFENLEFRLASSCTLYRECLNTTKLDLFKVLSD